ncbi:FAD binding domain-containing protein [Bauldia litoralis]|uniref:FAD binding domain-containing protein n=1 Tax=Bauldia litoralis TaxID=665467 RepID=UPI003266C993
MKPAAFSYESPSTLAEAMKLIKANAADGRVIAGGQSLVAAMNFRLARPDVLIDLNGVKELDFIEETPGELVIGAMTRHAAFHKPVCDGPLGRLLSKVVPNIAHYPIRNRGTFGGSLCHADPASEWCVVAATLDATMKIGSAAGDREVPVADFFRGSFTTAVEPGEILIAIRLPKLDAGWGTGFYEYSRRKGDFALAMALTALRVEGGAISAARVGLGGVADHGKRMADLEAALVGKPATAETFAEVGKLASTLVSPYGDIHGSAEYRRDLTATVVARALAEAADEATA